MATHAATVGPPLQHRDALSRIMTQDDSPWSPRMRTAQAKTMDLFLCGDVMTGRGVDQIWPHPSNPVLYESYLHDAREYVRLAEDLNGRIKRPVDFGYCWGEALSRLDGADVRIINLETSITTSEDAWPFKGINYRMNPRNIAGLTAARIDCCCLANNHVLDWGYVGLEETLQTLDDAGIAHAGAGRNAAAAARPAIIEVPGKGRVVVFAFGSTSSGIPGDWGATAERAGINLLQNLSEDTARQLANQMRLLKQPGDITVASIHWGSNWDYAIPPEQIGFAHRLVEGGVDLVHGHSSHHLKALEVYQERLILYGCGDFLDDYEGISGYEEYRPDLRLLYMLTVDPVRGRLIKAQLTPMQVRRFRLHQASAGDSAWICNLLNALCSRFQTQVQLEDGLAMRLQVPGSSG